MQLAGDHAELRRCVEHEIGLAVLMLSTAAIDILGGLYRRTSGKQESFVAFVADFLSKTYSPGELWKLR